jgi:HSP20 family protein
MAPRPFDLLDDFNRAYGSLLRQPVTRTEGAAGDWLPPADIREEPDRYVIQLDVPGMNCSQIDVTVHEGVLTVRGKRETEAKRVDMIRIERQSGHFVRQFRLPGVVAVESVDAALEQGVLTIVLPKAKQSVPHRITVR